MNWRLIFLLSMFGLAMGILTVYIIPSTIEPVFWLVIMVISAIAIAKKARGMYFAHGFAVSVVNALWMTLVHVILFYPYVENHPEYTQMTDALPPVLAAHPRRIMLIVGMIPGVIFGVVLGLLAWIAARIMSRR